MASFSRRNSSGPTCGCRIRTAAPASAFTSWRAHSRRNGSLASDSSPTSCAILGSSRPVPTDVRNAATMPPIACSQSGYSSCSSSSRNIDASRLRPGRMPGDSAVASRFAASTSNIRLSTNAGSASASNSCRIPAGTTSRRGRLAGAGRSADRLIR
jgi:hypothetical protein